MKKVAVFDFDHTLILGDSFWPYLVYAVGKPQTYTALAEGLALLGLRHMRGEKKESTRTYLKAHLLHRLLKGRKLEHLKSAAAKTRLWQRENASIMRRLREHHESGDAIVIASGGLDLYLPELLRDIPYDALICTDIGTHKDVVTGDMTKGNCVRLRQAERVAEWLAANGPFGESYGYGNYPHDVPMLNLVKHRIIVS